MKVDAPNDLEGRMICCVHRAKLVAEALYVFGHAAGDVEVSPEALKGLSLVAEELADELEALGDAHILESNTSDAAIEALKAKAPAG